MTQPSSLTDFSRYLPPGVYTNPTAGPQLAVNSSSPTAVALFGLSIGHRNFIESLLVNPDTNDTTPAINRSLAKQGINTSSVLVTNPNSGQVYVAATDYTIVNTGGTNGTSNALYTISRVISGHINPGDTIQVSYNFTDPTFYDPNIFYSYSDVVAAYGQPFNLTTGAIQSELTLAAKFAFLNGAYQLMCVAVNPANPSAPTVGDYSAALDKFFDQALVAIVVPCNGSMQPLQQIVQEHVDSQSNNRFERRAIIGMDGTVNPVSSSQRIINAQELSDERIALVCPATFQYFSPELNIDVTLGGQFMAAALAGMVMNMSFAQPLTHKVVVGFDDVVEIELDGQKNLESQNGLCVVEKTRHQLIRVRHGVSTDNSDMVHREWSITGQQDAMVYRLRDFLENANLIGQPIYDYTLVNVKASAEAALQSLVRDGLMVNYTGLSCRQLITNPDVLEITFSWQPAFPLNYIVVTFGVSLSTGSITAQGGPNGTTNFTSNSPNLNSQITAAGQAAFNDFGGPSNTLLSN